MPPKRLIGSARRSAMRAHANSVQGIAATPEPATSASPPEAPSAQSEKDGSQNKPQEEDPLAAAAKRLAEKESQRLSAKVSRAPPPQTPRSVTVVTPAVAAEGRARQRLHLFLCGSPRARMPFVECAKLEREKHRAQSCGDSSEEEWEV